MNSHLLLLVTCGLVALTGQSCKMFKRESAKELGLSGNTPPPTVLRNVRSGNGQFVEARQGAHVYLYAGMDGSSLRVNELQANGNQLAFYRNVDYFALTPQVCDAARAGHNSGVIMRAYNTVMSGCINAQKGVAEVFDQRCKSKGGPESDAAFADCAFAASLRSQCLVFHEYDSETRRVSGKLAFGVGFTLTRHSTEFEHSMEQRRRERVTGLEPPPAPSITVTGPNVSVDNSNVNSNENSSQSNSSANAEQSQNQNQDQNQNQEQSQNQNQDQNQSQEIAQNNPPPQPPPEPTPEPTPVEPEEPCLTCPEAPPPGAEIVEEEVVDWVPQPTGQTKKKWWCDEEGRWVYIDEGSASLNLSGPITTTSTGSSRGEGNATTTGVGVSLSFSYTLPYRVTTSGQRLRVENPSRLPLYEDLVKHGVINMCDMAGL